MKRKNENDVVISGLAGRFPESNSVHEFWNNLMSGKELYKSDDRRFPVCYMATPPNSGKIKDVEKFDHEFFEISEERANFMDLQIRKSLEVIYEAIYDAGVNPLSLRETNAAVFLGNSYDETTKQITNTLTLNDSEFGLINNGVSALSDFFGFKYAVELDSLCASSLSCFHEAALVIENGLCGSAVIVATAIQLTIAPSISFISMTTVSPEGHCRPLDSRANGYVRSEAVVAAFIQKRKYAKRIYGTSLAHRTINDGFKVESFAFPGFKTQRKLLEECISLSGIDPLTIDYVESHATGTSAGDPVEMRAIMQAYRPEGNKKPLAIGCVKSNAGHNEACAGLVALSKLAMIFQKHLIPANINYVAPNPQIEGIESGVLVPVIKHTIFDGNIIPISSFGMGGVGVHFIMKANEKTLSSDSFDIVTDIPRLINISGRTEDGVRYTIEWIQNNRSEVSREFLALLNDNSKISLESGMNSRGFMIIDGKQLIFSKVTSSQQRKQLCFVYSAINRDIRSIAKRLMIIQPFADSIHSSNAILSELDVDLSDLLRTDELGFNENGIVTAVIQMAITNVLHCLGVKADKAFGFFSGELAANYANELMDAKEALRNAVMNHKTTKALVDDIPQSSVVVVIGDGVDQLEDREGSIIINVFRSSDIVISLLSTIGEIYMNGSNPEIEKLYPKVDYPVGRETASLSPLLKWDLRKNLFWPKFQLLGECFTNCREEIDLTNPKWKFLDGHCIDSRIIFPATGYLYLIWLKYANSCGYANIMNTTVEFRDIIFHRSIVLRSDRLTSLQLFINERSRQFKVTNNGVLCVSGIVGAPDDKHLPSIVPRKTDTVVMKAKDIYKELRLRGYDYGLTFQGLVEAAADGSWGRLKWTGHVISYIDSLVQLMLLSRDERSLCIPSRFEYIRIDPSLMAAPVQNDTLRDVYYDKRTRSYVSAGIFVRGFVEKVIAKRKELNVCLEQQREINYDNSIATETSKMKLIKRRLEELHNELLQLSNEEIPTFIDRIKIDSGLKLLLASNMKELLLFPLRTVVQFYTKKLKVTEFNETGDALKDSILKEISNFRAVSEYTYFDSTDHNTLHSNANNSDVLLYKHQSMALMTGSESIADANTVSAFLSKCYSLLKNNGFLLLYFRTCLTELELLLIEKQRGATKPILTLDFTKLCIECGFKIVAENEDDFGFKSILCKKVKEITEKPLVVRTQVQNYEWVEDLKKIMKEKSENRIWITADNDKVNGVIGFVKCLLRETCGERIRCLVSEEQTIPKHIIDLDLPLNFYRNGIHGTIIHDNLEDVFVDDGDVYLDVVKKGDFSTLKWFQEMKFIEKNGISTKVYYSAINRVDTTIASGDIRVKSYPIPYFERLGIEFSGIDENGNKVFGIKSGSLASQISLTNNDFYFVVPNEWSLAEAATVPFAYSTAYLALIVNAKLKEKEKVLIHSGGTSMGQAAIIICLSMDCEVFTSFTSEKEKQFLQTQYPQLAEDHLLSAIPSCIEELARKRTYSFGVDVVVNTLDEEVMRASINCLSAFGRFVEVENHTFDECSPFDNTEFINRSYFSVCFHCLMSEVTFCKSKNAIKRLATIRGYIEEGIVTGVVKPLNYTEFNFSEPEKAFRSLSPENNIGKVLLRIRDEKFASTSNFRGVIPQTSFNPNKVYVLFGGLGGFGLEIAHWMRYRGAKKLVLTSRTGVKEVYQQLMIKKLEAGGMTVKVLVNNALTFEKMKMIFDEAMKMGPIGGLFNLTLVLVNDLIANQTIETFRTVCAPKIDVTILMDQLSRIHCPELDYFVCFSSCVSGKGSEGQTPYGFANTVVENICSERKKQNLPGLAIQWGAVGDVGYIHDNYSVNIDTEISGLRLQRMHSCLKVFDRFLNQPHPVVTSYILRDDLNLKESKADILATICKELNIDDVTLDRSMTLPQLGMDSLIAVVLKESFEMEHNLFLSATELRNLSLNEIIERYNKQSMKADPESLVATNLVTKSLSIKPMVRIDEGNRGQPIFFVPPVIGDTSVIKPLAQHVTRPVFAINWVDEVNIMDTVQSVAAFYANIIQKEHQMSFYDIVAISSGSVVALEMCVALENNSPGCIRSLIIVNGEPSFIKRMLMSEAIVGSPDTDQDRFEEMLELIFPQFGAYQTDEKLADIVSYEKRSELLDRSYNLTIMLGVNNMTSELYAGTADQFYKKIIQIYHYIPTKKFNGTVKLLYSAEEDEKSVAKDFSNYCDGNVELISLKSDSKTFLKSNYEQIGCYIDNVMQVNDSEV